MITTLVNALEIVNYGNAWLQGLVTEVDFRKLPGYRYVKSISITNGWDQSSVETEFSNLFKYFESQGCLSARLLAQPFDVDPVAFRKAWAVGAECWGPSFTHPKKDFNVLVRATVVDKHAADQRIWHYQYGLFRRAPGMRVLPDDPDCETKLRHTLEDAATFCDCDARVHLKERFEAALQVLDGKVPWDVVEGSFVPGIGDDESRKLVLAVNLGWCFGGMGSWNDMHFEHEAEEERYWGLSARMWDAMLSSLCWAVRPPKQR